MKNLIPGFALLIFLVACGDRRPLEEGSVARVNGVDIPQEDFDREMAFLLRQAEGKGYYFEEGDPQMNSMRREILNTLVVQQLIREEAVKKDIRPQQEEVQKLIEAQRAQEGSEEAFQLSLEERGLSEEILVKNMEWASLLDQVLTQEVYDKIDVRDDELLAYYEENKEDYFMVPESLELSHILVEIREDRSQEEAFNKIVGIRDEIEGGMPFGEAAARYSDGPSALREGVIGQISPGQTSEAFEAAAFSLEPGVVSDPVLTEFGYHLILVSAKNPEKERPFQDVETQIRSILEAEKGDFRVREYINGLQAKAKIVLPDWVVEEEKGWP